MRVNKIMLTEKTACIIRPFFLLVRVLKFAEIYIFDGSVLS